MLVLLLAAVTTVAALVHAWDLGSRLAQSSDSAQAFVAGKAIADGNILLSGWRLSIDNFYFTDALPYAAFEWILGPRPFLMVLLPTLTYALFVFTALVACLDRAQPIIRNIEAAAVIAFFLASPVFIGGWDPLLLSCFHTATVVGALVTLMLCASVSAHEDLRSPGRLGSGAALVAFSAATLASDPLSFVFAFGPALAVLAVEAGTRRRGTGLALVLLTSGTAIGFLLPPIIACAGGGFAAVNYVANGITPSQWKGNLLTQFFGALALLGANPLSYQGGTEALLFLINRAIAFALLVCTLGFFAWRWLRRRQTPLFDRLLCAGIGIFVVACTVSTQFTRMYTVESSWNGGAALRYIFPTFLFGAVLAGRWIPRTIDGLQHRNLQIAARATLLPLAALAMCLGDWREKPPTFRRDWIQNGPAAQAAQWLEQHGLRQGVGEYLSANLITAISGDKVRVRSVIPSDGRLRPYIWAEDGRSYKPEPQFVIWREPNSTGFVAAQVRATYIVCRTVAIATYRVALLCP